MSIWIYGNKFPMIRISSIFLQTKNHWHCLFPAQRRFWSDASFDWGPICGAVSEQIHHLAACRGLRLSGLGPRYVDLTSTSEQGLQIICLRLMHLLRACQSHRCTRSTDFIESVYHLLLLFSFWALWHLNFLLIEHLRQGSIDHLKFNKRLFTCIISFVLKTYLLGLGNILLRDGFLSCFLRKHSFLRSCGCSSLFGLITD